MTITSQRGKINLVYYEKGGYSGWRSDDTRESIGDLTHLGWVVPCGEGDHRRDLQKAHLKGVRRADLHTTNSLSSDYPSKNFFDND